jgi:hypothetical protein
MGKSRSVGRDWLREKSHFIYLVVVSVCRCVIRYTYSVCSIFVRMCPVDNFYKCAEVAATIDLVPPAETDDSCRLLRLGLASLYIFLPSWLLWLSYIKVPLYLIQAQSGGPSKRPTPCARQFGISWKPESIFWDL